MALYRTEFLDSEAWAVLGNVRWVQSREVVSTLQQLQERAALAQRRDMDWLIQCPFVASGNGRSGSIDFTVCTYVFPYVYLCMCIFVHSAIRSDTVAIRGRHFLHTLP